MRTNVQVEPEVERTAPVNEPSGRQRPDHWPGSWWRLGVLILPVIWILPGLAGFPYASALARYSDLTISHYPNAIYLRHALSEWGTIPLWSPSILSGFPFAANPLSGLWYPPGWLALLMPLPFGFNLMMLLHLIWGGIGMYSLVKKAGVGDWGALFGSISFVAMPKLIAHLGAGHLSLIYAIPWTPWLLSVGHRRHLRAKALGQVYQPALVLGFIILADVRWAFYAGALWWAWTLLWSHAPTLRDAGPAHIIGFIVEKTRDLLWLLCGTVLAAMISAPLLLPLWEFSRLSTRAGLSSQEALTFSLPPARMLGLIFPDFGGNQEWIVYPGAVVLCLALLSIVWSRSRPLSRFWVVVLGVSIIYAMGAHFPLAGALAQLPGLGQLRVPARALFLAGMAMSFLAAFALDNVVVGVTRAEQRWGRLTLTSLSLLTIFLALGVWLLTRTLPANFVWGAAAVAMGSIWVIIGLQKQHHKTRWFAILLGICLLDWYSIGRSVLNFRPATEVFSEGAAVVGRLSGTSSDFRSYSPSYSLPQQTAIRNQIELADGVDPLQLASYAAFMDSATGVPRAGYSVTLPPFETGDPLIDNAEYVPDARLLGLLNVGYVLSAFDLTDDNLQLHAVVEGTRIYRNAKSLPRAWVQPPEPALPERVSPARITSWRPNRIEIHAEGPGLLVLSEIDYPGWQVYVDGRRTQMRTVAGLLRATVLEPGAHQITFRFIPHTVFIGLGLAAAAIVLISLATLYMKRSDEQG